MTTHKNILQKILSEDYVHVVDNFYESLDWFKAYLVNADFDPSQNLYPKLTGMPPENVTYARDKIDSILGERMKYDAYDGQIRLVKTEDEGKESALIHFDFESINVLVYLTEPPLGCPLDEYGTYFYYHNQLKSSRIDTSNKMKVKIQDTVCLRDTKNLEQWTKWLTIPCKLNRAILFDGHLFHSRPVKFYGDSKWNCRATQNFFPLRLNGAHS